MEDVPSIEDEADKELTETINKMVNKSLSEETQANKSVNINPGPQDEDGVLEVDQNPDVEGEEVPDSHQGDEETTTTAEEPPVVPDCQSCKPAPCQAVPCKPVPCQAVPCKPDKPAPCHPVPCEPVACRPMPCKPVRCKPVACKPSVSRLPCQPVPCTPVGCEVPPGTAGPGMMDTPVVPVAFAVGAAASVLVLGVVAMVGFLIRYLPIYISGTVFVGSVLLTCYLSSRYPASARELGLRALGAMRDAATSLVDRVSHAITRQEFQVSSCLR
jgi:hypothetical protein